MAIGYPQVELDAPLAILEEAVPPIPTGHEKRAATRVTAMRVAGTDKGAVFNSETKGGETEIFWFNCWVAKELAAAISFASQTYGWAKRGLAARPSKHLKGPERADIAMATEVLSLSTLGEPGGILVRMAVGQPIKHRLLFFPARAALEMALVIGEAGIVAAWREDELLADPLSRESTLTRPAAL